MAKANPTGTLEYLLMNEVFPTPESPVMKRMIDMLTTKIIASFENELCENYEARRSLPLVH